MISLCSSGMPLAPRPLEADDRDQVAVEPALLEGREQLLLGVEDHGRRLDDRLGAVGQGGDLDHGPAEVAGEHLEPARRRKGRRLPEAITAGVVERSGPASQASSPSVEHRPRV